MSAVAAAHPAAVVQQRGAAAEGLVAECGVGAVRIQRQGPRGTSGPADGERLGSTWDGAATHVGPAVGSRSRPCRNSRPLCRTR